MLILKQLARIQSGLASARSEHHQPQQDGRGINNSNGSDHAASSTVAAPGSPTTRRLDLMGLEASTTAGGSAGGDPQNGALLNSPVVVGGGGGGGAGPATMATAFPHTVMVPAALHSPGAPATSPGQTTATTLKKPESTSLASNLATKLQKGGAKGKKCEKLLFHCNVQFYGRVKVEGSI